MNEINTDALAEMHYVKYDPAYQTEEDLEMEKEKIESRALQVLEITVKNVLKVLDNDELHALAENREEICEWLDELLGEYE